MAPRQPLKKRTTPRTRAGAKSASSSAASGTSLSLSSSSSSKIGKTFQPGTKAAKREQKHTALLSRINKNFSTAKPLKRRRPSKKLAASLSSLVDALPDESEGAGSDGADEDAVTTTTNGLVRVRNKSLKSRPGAQKRRAMLEAMEKSWFDQNMASMVKAQPKQQGLEPRGEDSTTDMRWASLKQHIQGNLEKINQQSQLRSASPSKH